MDCSLSSPDQPCTISPRYCSRCSGRELFSESSIVRPIANYAAKPRATVIFIKNAFRSLPVRSRLRQAGIWSLSQSLFFEPGGELTSSPHVGHFLPPSSPSSALSQLDFSVPFRTRLGRFATSFPSSVASVAVSDVFSSTDSAFDAENCPSPFWVMLAELHPPGHISFGVPAGEAPNITAPAPATATPSPAPAAPPPNPSAAPNLDSALPIASATPPDPPVAVSAICPLRSLRGGNVSSVKVLSQITCSKAVVIASGRLQDASRAPRHGRRPWCFSDVTGKRKPDRDDRER